MMKYSQKFSDFLYVFKYVLISYLFAFLCIFLGQKIQNTQNVCDKRLTIALILTWVNTLFNEWLLTCYKTYFMKIINIYIHVAVV